MVSVVYLIIGVFSFPLFQALNIMVCHKINCSKYGVEWVCGSDGKDYLNRCELNRMRCFGSPVEEVGRERCKDMISQKQVLSSIQTCNDYKLDTTKQILLKYWKVKYFNQFGLFSGYFRVLDYIFSLLDLNLDEKISFSEWIRGIIDEKEIQLMKLELKCLQRILKSCDFDNSRAINRDEWAECFEITVKSFQKFGGDGSTQKESFISTLVPIKHGKLFAMSKSGEKYVYPTKFSHPDAPVAKEIPKNENNVATYETVHKLRNDVCFGDKRRRFLQLLFAQFRSEMQLYGLMPEGGMGAARRQSAEWKFTQMDVNEDGYLCHHEYHTFRRMIRHWEGVKRCGRSFIRQCDQDSDKRVSLDEWKRCTITAFDETKIIPKSNPLLYLLNSG
ncbi:unnamed protein product [Bursaphelenchus xylophilus]|uniref:(pine wood nematode) hypothetical protein n=1 Tax=Bursaphelenchus xylophilus TaxID=6326 RepID=A0A1I7RP41_BURXY|nr:unnamed protein product [Bursaphelenchus xylophilus]CAG9124529.1 unnamed protein product [Bursaphelenchus xylophilus]